MQPEETYDDEQVDLVLHTLEVDAVTSGVYYVCLLALKPKSP